MWIVAVMAVAAATLASFLADQNSKEHALSALHDAALARVMAAERAVALEWAQNHPGHDGELAPSLSTPLTLSEPIARLRVTIQGRVVAVYFEGQRRPGLLAELTQLSRGSMLVGVANRGTGTLHSPIFGDTRIALPDAVPEGAPVWLAVRS